MTERAVKHVRKFLGQRLRSLRKQRLLSQERLGARSRLSGKFIGEAERGANSISLDTLYHFPLALEVRLRDLTDVCHQSAPGPSLDSKNFYSLVSSPPRS